MDCCGLHKKGKYSHWPCGTYDPDARRKIYLAHGKKCLECGTSISQFSKINKCRACSQKGKSHYLKGKKLPQWWKDRITNKFQGGGKHWNWKGGASSNSKKLRTSSEFKRWREAVFERDNYICVFCNKKGGELHPDHIKELSKFPNLVFDVDNGRTLCKECHQKRHYKHLTTHRPKELICALCRVKYKPKGRGTWRNNSKNHFCSMAHRDQYSSIYGNTGQFKKLIF